MAKRRKSETAFQYSKRLLAIRQEKLQAEISRIQAEGYTVPKAVIEQAENLQAGIRSDRQARQRLSVMTVSRIRGMAYKEFVIARQKMTATTSSGKITAEAPPITVRKGYGKGAPTPEDIAREMLKGLRYHFRKHPTRDTADSIAQQLLNIQKMSGVKLINPKKRKRMAWSARHMPYILNKLSPETLGKALDIAEQKSQGTIEQTLNLVYDKGHASPSGYKAFIDVAREVTKDAFKTKHEFTDNEVEDIYDFFKTSREWSKFRYANIGKYNVEELREIVMSDNADFDFDKLEVALQTGATWKDVVARYNEII